LSERIASRQEPRRLKTRAALIAAGEDLLAERAIEAIPVNDIVERANVAKGSFFNHFADKDDFAATIAANIRANVEAQVSAINGGVRDPAARLVRGIAQFVRFALVEPRSARIMLRGHRRAVEAEHPLNAGLRADIAAGCREGRLMAPSEDAALTFVIGTGQILLAAVIEKGLDGAQAAALSTDVLQMLLSGFGVAAAEARELAQDATRSVVV